MPRLEFAKEACATCNHALNRKRKAVIATLLVCLTASTGGLVTGCVLEIRWAILVGMIGIGASILVGIIGIGASILGLFIAMDSMRKEYIQLRDQAYTIDHVTIICDDEVNAATNNNEIKVMHLV